MSTTTELIAANERHNKLRAAIEALAAEWLMWAEEDERWLNGPRVEANEAQELPVLIRQARAHADDLRALLDDQETNR